MPKTSEKEHSISVNEWCESNLRHLFVEYENGEIDNKILGSYNSCLESIVPENILLKDVREWWYHAYHESYKNKKVNELRLNGFVLRKE